MATYEETVKARIVAEAAYDVAHRVLQDAIEAERVAREELENTTKTEIAAKK